MTAYPKLELTHQQKNRIIQLHNIQSDRMEATIKDLEYHQDKTFFAFLPPESKVLMAKPSVAYKSISNIPDVVDYKYTDQSCMTGNGDEVTLGNCLIRHSGHAYGMQTVWKATERVSKRVSTIPFDSTGRSSFFEPSSSVALYAKQSLGYLRGEGYALGILASDTLLFPPKFYNRENASFLGLPKGTIITFGNGGTAIVEQRSDIEYITCTLDTGANVKVYSGTFLLKALDAGGRVAFLNLERGDGAKWVWDGGDHCAAHCSLYSTNSSVRPLMHKTVVPFTMPLTVGDYPFTINPLWLSDVYQSLENIHQNVEAFLMG